MRAAGARAWLALWLTLAALAALVGVSVGSAGFGDALGVLLEPRGDTAAAATARQIVFDIRLPRVAAAWLAGALLGLAGAIAQGLFRNPLADPYLLGSAAGASLAVALVLAWGAGVAGALGTGGVMRTWGVWEGHLVVRLGLTAAAFVGAWIAVLLTLLLARGVQHTVRLLLAGVVVGVVLGALTQLVLLWAPDALQSMQAFLLGSTAFVGWPAVGLMATAWAACVLSALLGARVLDGLSLGEATALSLGLPLVRLRLWLVAVLALATATAVAQTGWIAFVGLVAPHLVRAMVKTTHAWLLGLSSVVGGTLLLVADVLARAVIAPQEIPVGVLTAVVGGSYLWWLMHRGAVRAGG
ncbi:MAG: FecCD family ABC transporter permease [Tepidimonas sp.]|uniref:FecCD family ABC transporter permease n=1 Tax=Tepidimonas sp. TaxID=2002775 RepID=UPI004054B35A